MSIDYSGAFSDQKFMARKLNGEKRGKHNQYIKKPGFLIKARLFTYLRDRLF
jgi:hypothetical protein